MKPKNTNLIQNLNQNEIPEEHKQILSNRIDALEAGRTKLIEWEKAKEKLLLKLDI